ncbi:MAG: hypothetical protein A3B68_00495 [Candidatus Melainabacteria bacterium RIFCSPHIGHO2_02_FULL_34_12]|nr:MAG: hypothetical protein A3B68_00495 [Candidatus Melainabacteria bacterium RIFCSPHIGHO2_02_FULL_34_12]
MSEVKNKNIFESKNKEAVETSSESVTVNEKIEIEIENPIEKLRFKKNQIKKKTNLQLISSLAVFILISSSIILNSFFLKTLDPKLFELFSTISEFLHVPMSKPYVVTVGEYGNLSVAKDEAIKLLPKFKQIDIKKLDNGIYTFEMERLGSKSKAYSFAKELTQDGFDAVHVRYLPMPNL